MAFASVADLAAFLQRDLGDSDLTEQAALALDLATAAIQAEAGQQLTQATETITLSPIGAVVLLPELPVQTVTAVVVAGVTLDPADYTVSTLGILRRADGAAWAGDVTVTYAHGHATIPDDLRAVCLQAAARVLANPGAVQAESVGAYSVTYARPGSDGSGAGVLLAADERALVRRYRP
jgi:hypothetical protein